jgi:hypothetical protein
MNGDAGTIHAAHLQDMDADELCNAKRGAPDAFPLGRRKIVSGSVPRSARVYVRQSRMTFLRIVILL